MPKKTAERRAAELIAKSEGIKLKSAYRRIQRAAKAQKPVKAPKQLTRYGKGLFSKAVKQTKAKAKPQHAKKQVSPPTPELPEIKRKNFFFSGVSILKAFMAGTFGSSGSGDRRERWVRTSISADQANYFFAAFDWQDAISRFNDLVPYMEIFAERVAEFEFRGESYRKSFFD